MHLLLSRLPVYIFLRKRARKTIKLPGTLIDFFFCLNSYASRKSKEEKRDTSDTEDISKCISQEKTEGKTDFPHCLKGEVLSHQFIHRFFLPLCPWSQENLPQPSHHSACSEWQHEAHQE